MRAKSCYQCHYYYHPEFRPPRFSSDLFEIAKEKIGKFNQVPEPIKAKGLKLGRERKDDYVNDLVKFLKKDGSRQQSFLDRLLFSAMIEARSCERFKVLSQNIQDKELAKFYHELMVSEAGHYTTFLGYARKYCGELDIEKRWQEWINYEDSIIRNYGKKETVHG